MDDKLLNKIQLFKNNAYYTKKTYKKSYLFININK